MADARGLGSFPDHRPHALITPSTPVMKDLVGRNFDCPASDLRRLSKSSPEVRMQIESFTGTVSVRARPANARWARVALPAALTLSGLALWLLAGGAHIGGAVKPSAQQAVSRHGLSSVPLTARGPLSAALGRHELGYRVVGLRAHNSAQGLGVNFSRAGVRVTSASTHVSMRLVNYGRTTATAPTRKGRSACLRQSRRLSARRRGRVVRQRAARPRAGL